MLILMDSSRRSPESPGSGLLASAGGDSEFAGQLAAIFVEEASRRLAALRSSADSHDLTNLEAAAHSLKGAAAALGYGELARRAEALEAEARAGRLTPGDAARFVERVRESCEEAQRDARAFLGEGE
jgi:HPt (histidine-containing phosphotransfer) domain-containing protein